MKKTTLLGLMLMLLGTSAIAQKKKTSFSQEPFEALKICNLESTKVIGDGELAFIVGHRFGSVNGGVKTFWGLDQSNTKIQLLYGIKDKLQLGVSRESIRKTYSGDAKWRLMNQGKGKWMSMTAYTSIHVNTELNADTYPKMRYFDRLSYSTQLLMAKKVSERVTLELAPTFVRQNLVLEPFQAHEQIAVGLGTRIRLSQRMSMNVEYIVNLSRAEESVYRDPFSLGLDFETGGHVFQLLFSNAQSMYGPGYVTNAEGSWWKGDFFFGFNIVRRFRLH